MTCLLIGIFVLLLQSSFSHIIRGILEPFNYDYYVFSFNTPPTLILMTSSGDADLFVSQSSNKPSYHEYDLQSTTTGTECIVIPGSFSSPIEVGIFAAAQYGNTSYTLQISTDELVTDKYGKLLRYEDASTPWTWADLFWVILELILEIIVWFSLMILNFRI